MRLLLAEDELELSRALTAILRHSGYEVDAVHDGLTALDHLRHQALDAAILDIMMPGMDGIEVLRQARQSGIRLPIIMLTAKSEVADKVEGLDAGANDYLTKPFAAKELLARIRAMTRSATAIDATTLSVGNVRLDCASCTLAGPAGGRASCQSRVSAHGVFHGTSRVGYAHRAPAVSGVGRRCARDLQRGVGLHFLPAQETLGSGSQRVHPSCAQSGIFTRVR